MNVSREVVLGAFVLTTLIGCGPFYETVKISDRTTLPTLRVSKQVYSPRTTRGSLSDPETGIAVEVGLSSAHGRDSQFLGAGQIRIGNTTFLGPQSLNSEAELEILDISARWRHLFKQGRVGYEAVLGASHARLDVAVASASQSDTEKLAATGIRLGAGAIWRMFPTTRLEARGTVLLATYDFEDIARYELFLVQALGKNVAARAGYSLWRANADPDQRSNIDVKLSGFSFGLDLNF